MRPGVVIITEEVDGWFAEIRAAAPRREAAEARLPALPAEWRAEVTVDDRGMLREDD